MIKIAGGMVPIWLLIVVAAALWLTWLYVVLVQERRRRKEAEKRWAEFQNTDWPILKNYEQADIQLMTNLYKNHFDEQRKELSDEQSRNHR